MNNSSNSSAASNTTNNQNKKPPTGTLQKYKESVGQSMNGKGSWHKTVGILLTFILLLAASIMLMADSGANILAYVVILCLLLFPTTLLLVVSNFTKGTRVNNDDLKNKPDFVVFGTIFVALVIAITLCLTPMLTFVETETYADGSTVTPGHSGVQTMTRGQRVSVGVVGVLVALILFGVYFVVMYKNSGQEVSNRKPYKQAYQGVSKAANRVTGAASAATKMGRRIYGGAKGAVEGMASGARQGFSSNA